MQILKTSTLPLRKSFTAPVWWLIVLVVFQLISLFSLYLVTRKYELENVSFASAYITRGVYISVIIGECLFYWQYRKRIRSKKLAWAHIAGMILVFLILPLAQTLVTLWLTRTETSGGYGDAMILMNKVSMAVFWSLFIIAHLFFAMLITNGLGNKYDETEDIAGPDILNEYADKP